MFARGPKKLCRLRDFPVDSTRISCKSVRGFLELHRSVESLAGALDFLMISQVLPAWPASAAFWASSARGFSKRLEDFSLGSRRWNCEAGSELGCAVCCPRQSVCQGCVGSCRGWCCMDFIDRCPSTTPLGPDASSSASENSSFETSCYVGV